MRTLSLPGSRRRQANDDRESRRTMQQTATLRVAASGSPGVPRWPTSQPINLTAPEPAVNLSFEPRRTLQPHTPKRIDHRMPISFLRALAVTLASALLLSFAQVRATADPVSADIAKPATTPTTVEEPDPDPTTVAQIAATFQTGDTEAAVELAEAAAPQAAIDLEPAKGSDLAKADTEHGAVLIDADGVAALTNDSGGTFTSISVAGDPSSVEIVNGALVQTEVAPATDVITRVVEDGVQMVAILGDETAPNAIEFPLELPEDAELDMQADGSILVTVEVEVDVPKPGELDRIQHELEAVLGSNEVDSPLTDEQQAALEAIHPVEVQTVTQSEHIATIEAPWAIDANGEPVATHYEISEIGIVQAIEIGPDSAFPVVADPAITPVEWVQYIAGRAWDIALFAVGSAKLLKAFAKTEKIIKASSKLAAAWKTLGGKVDKVLNKIIGFLRQKDPAKYKRLTSAERIALAKQEKAIRDLIKGVGTLIATILGVENCVTLVRKVTGI